MGTEEPLPFVRSVKRASRPRRIGFCSAGKEATDARKHRSVITFRLRRKRVCSRSVDRRLGQPEPVCPRAVAFHRLSRE